MVFVSFVCYLGGFNGLCVLVKFSNVLNSLSSQLFLVFGGEGLVCGGAQRAPPHRTLPFLMCVCVCLCFLFLFFFCLFFCCFCFVLVCGGVFLLGLFFCLFCCLFVCLFLLCLFVLECFCCFHLLLCFWLVSVSFFVFVGMVLCVILVLCFLVCFVLFCRLGLFVFVLSVYFKTLFPCNSNVFLFTVGSKFLFDFCCWFSMLILFCCLLFVLRCYFVVNAFCFFEHMIRLSYYLLPVFLFFFGLFSALVFC